MRLHGIVLTLSLTSACTPCDDGDAVASCVECGPGALREGRAFGTLQQVEVSPLGNVVRTCGAKDHLAWLGSDFTVAHETEIETANAHGEVVQFGVNAASEVAAVLLSENDRADAGILEGELAVYEANGKQRWRKLVLGNTDPHDVSNVEIGPHRVFVATRSGITAYDLSTGEQLWSLDKRGPITAHPAGGLLVGGGFVTSVDLGGTAPVLTAPDKAAYVARFDDDGVARSAIAFTGTSYPTVVDIAVAPGGGTAFVGRWSGPESTFADISLRGADGDDSLFVALVDEDGSPRFVHPLGPAYLSGRSQRPAGVCSVATDGREVIVAGMFEHRPLLFDPEARDPIDEDAYVGSFDASGLTWLRIGSGDGDQEAQFDALSDGIVGTFYTPADLQFGDVTLTAGTTLAKLAR